MPGLEWHLNMISFYSVKFKRHENGKAKWNLNAKCKPIESETEI